MGMGQEIFPVMRGGAGMGQEKSMRGGDEDPILRPRPAPLPSLIVTESLMSIAVDLRVECFTVESHASQAFLETTNATTFTDEDIEVEYLDHRRPFYLTATINGV